MPLVVGPGAGRPPRGRGSGVRASREEARERDCLVRHAPGCQPRKRPAPGAGLAEGCRQDRRNDRQGVRRLWSADRPCSTRWPTRWPWATTPPASCWPRRPTPTAPAPTEVPDVLKDTKRQPFYRANLALAYAKAPVQPPCLRRGAGRPQDHQGGAGGRPGGLPVPPGRRRACRS